MLPPKLAFLDVETTGLRPTYDRIIEIGILRVEEGKLIRSYQTLIDPGFLPAQEITVLTGITITDLEKAPTFKDVVEDILEMIDGCVLVAHNARFDYSFLKNELKRVNVPYTAKQLCTVKLFKALCPRLKAYNLDSLIDTFGLKCSNRHRAFDDAKVLWDFYEKLIKSYDLSELEKVISYGLKRPSWPVKVPAEVLEKLPEKPGVYLFYGENGAPLYVGKSVSLKSRVLSHFSSDTLSAKEMQLSQQVRQIETIVTAGELGALILESQLIKKLQPLYNRRLRLSQRLVGIKKVKNSLGYDTLVIESLTVNNQTDWQDIVGVFRSTKQAKAYLLQLCKSYNLCYKLLSLEKPTSGCFGYRLGKCDGACLGKISNLRYNLKLSESLAKNNQNRIKDWPFAGPIAILESDGLENRNEQFIFDKWCFLGKKSLGEDFESLDQNQTTFDLDTYKIIERFLKVSKNLKKVKRLKSLPSWNEV